MNQLTATKNIDIPKLTSLGGVDLQFYGFFISQNMGENRVLCIHTIRIVLALFCLVRGYPIPRKNPENQTPENSKVPKWGRFDSNPAPVLGFLQLRSWWVMVTWDDSHGMGCFKFVTKKNT